ncbi:uncharacterized protein LOC6569038 [Drosophila grimshawi]|uniref:GH22762 n=1 Tax=Drosophila grimshawi TaxID=7222 RepID=B4JWD0_DROGR|nr:uncharacterized protein LOC6569038 [Drosophila grimshawi]EDV98268.1 GH22762 [Drosophila grimshawi]
MKVQIFVTIFVLCSFSELVLSQSAADLAAYQGLQKACIKELNIPDAEAAQITDGKSVSNGSEGYKCYHSCLYKKLGLVTADGKPNNDAVIKYTQARYSKVPADKVKSQLTSCFGSTAKSANSCEFIGNFEQCVSKAL